MIRVYLHHMGQITEDVYTAARMSDTVLMEEENNDDYGGHYNDNGRKNC